MAENFFDRFDEDEAPAGNFFDQFDEPAPEPPADAGIASRINQIAGRQDAVGPMGRRPDATATPRRERQPIADLGKRAARGATEVAASVPEALAVAGTALEGGEESTLRFARQQVEEAQREIDIIDGRLKEDMSESARDELTYLRDGATKRRANYLELITDAPERDPQIPVQERELFKKGQAVRESSTEFFGAPDPQFDDRLVSKIAEGGGNLAALAGLSVLTGGIAGPGAGLAAGAGAGAGLNASSMYRDAINSGATEEEAQKASAIGGIVGLGEVLPIGRAFDLLPANLRKKAASAIGRRIANGFATAGEEGAQEAAQNIMNTLTAKGIYDPDREVFTKDLAEDALVGAILGGGLGVVAPAPAPIRGEQLLTEADRASAIPDELIAGGKDFTERLLAGENVVAQPQAALQAPDVGTAPDMPGADAAPQVEAPSAISAEQADAAPTKPERAAPVEAGTVTVKLEAPEGETGAGIEITGDPETVARQVDRLRPQPGARDAAPEAASPVARTEVESVAPASANYFDQFDEAPGVEANIEPVDRLAVPEAPAAPPSTSPRPGLAAAGEWAAGREAGPVDEWLPVRDESGETGEYARLNPQTGAVEISRNPQEAQAIAKDPATPVEDISETTEDLASRPVEGPVESIVPENSSGRRTGSWVIRERATGETIMETFDRQAVERLKTDRFEAVPIEDYLGELNTPGTVGYAQARGETSDMGNPISEQEDAGQLGEAERASEFELTPEGEQFVISGAEQSQERSDAARLADDMREIEVRAQQSAMRTTVPQEDAGPLFDDQPDLLDRKEQRDAGSFYQSGENPSPAQEVQRSELTPAPRVKEDLIAAGIERAKKLQIPNVTFDIDPDMEARGAVEISRDRAAKIIFGTTLNGAHTTNHEAVHVLKAMNLFKDKEWAALEKEARNVWAKRYNVAETYGDLDEAGQVEEAIAEAFADYIQNGKKPATTALQNVFAKMKRFFRAMRETLTGQGITRVEDIFDRIDEGKVGSRTRVVPEAVRKEQRPATAALQLSRQGQEALPGDNALLASDVPAQAYDTARREGRGRVRALKDREGARFERFREVVQDRFLSLRRLDESTAAATGQEEIDSRESVYKAEERYSGRTGHALAELDDQYVTPLVGQIANDLSDFEVTHDGETYSQKDAVSMWLYARHAKERNAHIASINDDLPDGGSGLTNTEADAILAQAAGSQRTLDKIGKRIDQLAKEMVDLRERSGLLSKAEADVWRAMYKHYVPLQNFAETDMYDGLIGGTVPRVGRKFSTGGKEAKAALGRTSLAFDPLSTLLAQAQETIVRAEKNVVGQTMLDYATKYENPALYEIAKVETQRFFDKTSGKVVTRDVTPGGRPVAENEMVVKRGGDEYRIVFHDERLARAMGQVGVEQLGAITQGMSKVHRYFSAVYTMLSPTFVVTNALRDGLSASVNLGAFGKEDAGKLRAAAMNPKKWVQAWRGVHRGLNGKYDTEYAKWFKEFSETGGKVHFWNIENPGDSAFDLEKRVWLKSGNKAQKAWKSMRQLNTRDNPVLGAIENVNMAVDNAIRLSTYVKAREIGWTKEDAASLAKNLTVNFNRRGEWGSQINAFILFFNAAVQGTQVTLKAMKAPAVKKAVAGMAITGMASDIVAAMLSEEDEDGELEYDQIPEYKSQRALILPMPIGDEGYVTIPLPYGYNLFFYMGQQAGKIARGVKEPQEAAGEVFMTAVEAFSPISGRDPLDFVLPQPARIARDFIENEDAFGRPIRPEYPYADWGPQSYMEYAGASNASTNIARLVNRATGGSSTESGFVDVSPEYFDHAFKSLLGGMGTFGRNVYRAGERAATGNLSETEAYEIPLLRVLYTTSGDYLNQGRYYDFSDQVDEANAMVKRARAGGDSRELRDITQRQLNLAGLYGDRKLARRRLRDIKDKMEPIYANDALSDRQRTKLLEPLIDQRNRVYLTFNKAFIQRMGPQAE